MISRERTFTGLTVVLVLALVVEQRGRAASDGGSSPAEAPAPGALQAGGLYWRCHLSFRRPKFVPALKDRRGRTITDLTYYRGWHVAPMVGRVRSPDPPADWTSPDFDDSSWPRQLGITGAGGGWHDPVVRVKRLRTRFEVPDPGRVRRLDLVIEYIGGTAVYLNGAEAARRHLPDGPLTGDTLADGYPSEAYEWGLPTGKDNYPLPAHAWTAPSEKARRWRRLAVSLDTKRLRPGTNVLAVSLHQSGYGAFAARWRYDNMSGYKMCPWPHLALRTLTLEAAPADAVAAPARPDGVQVWVADIHQRLVNRDFGEARDRSPIIRLVGARNGTYSGQVVVGATSALAGVIATVGELSQPDGKGTIPADAVRVRYGVGLPLAQMPESRFGRHMQFLDSGAMALLGRYYPGGYRFKNRAERAGPPKNVVAEARRIALFDQLAERPPESVPADSCQPIWVTVQVPKDAPPGEYRGTLTVEAGATKTVEIRLWVFDWALPDTRDFASFVGLQQSLWGACRQYECRPWSEAHLKHLERTVRMLAAVGNDVAVLPLIVGGESKNDESLVPWVKRSVAHPPSGGQGEAHRGAGGPQYDYDWQHLDRYLDLVARHWGTKCALVGEICWVPWRGGKVGWPVIQPGVTLLEDGQKNGVRHPDGKVSDTVFLPLPAPGSEEWNRVFLPFAKALRQHVGEKGFENLHWGWFYDGVPDGLRAMALSLAEAVPDVGWARASHNGNTRRPFPKDSPARVNLDIHIRGFPQPFDRKQGDPVSRYGWKSAGNLLFPRQASEVQAVGRFEYPMSLRWLTENCLVNGAAGFGRIGADYWPPFDFGNWYAPFATHLLYPGPDGAESSVRFEALREGVQEAEVRILLERAGQDQAQPAKSVLAERIRLLGAVPTGSDYQAVGEYYSGWQRRSWDLYAAAAAAFGGAQPGDGDRRRFFASNPS